MRWLRADSHGRGACDLWGLSCVGDNSVAIAGAGESLRTRQNNEEIGEPDRAAAVARLAQAVEVLDLAQQTAFEERAEGRAKTGECRVHLPSAG